MIEYFDRPARPLVATVDIGNRPKQGSRVQYHGPRDRELPRPLHNLFFCSWSTHTLDRTSAVQSLHPWNASRSPTNTAQQSKLIQDRCRWATRIIFSYSTGWLVSSTYINIYGDQAYEYEWEEICRMPNMIRTTYRHNNKFGSKGISTTYISYIF